jgi:mRNA-degrading endonuclease toxin of MazEF toxin-antitoxin module
MSLPALRRGSVVTVASPGVYSGKPRPAVVVQADRWLQAHLSRVNPLGRLATIKLAGEGA